MVELLADWKAIVVAIDQRPMTTTDFRAAWARSWEIMVDERAWAHATRFRRGSRISMLAARHEARCSFLDEPSAFAFATGRLGVAAGNMCLQLEPTQVPAALLAAIGYTQTMAEFAEYVEAA